jgi:predicted secreted protein
MVKQQLFSCGTCFAAALEVTDPTDIRLVNNHCAGLLWELNLHKAMPSNSG